MDEPANAQTNAENAPQGDGMGGDAASPASRLLAAERRLEHARLGLRSSMERLGALRRAALAGKHDPEALDEAVFACREAEARVRAARTDVERAQARAFGAAAGEAAAAREAAPVGAQSEPQEGASAAASAEAAGTAGAAGTAEPAPEPLEVTPRLLFARWLVQTGRLSEDVAA